MTIETIQQKLEKNTAAFVDKPSSKLVDERARLNAELELAAAAETEAAKKAARQAETDKLQSMADDLADVTRGIAQCETDIGTHRTKLEKLQSEIKDTEAALVATNNAHLRFLVRKKVIVKFATDNGIVWTDAKSWRPLIEAQISDIA